MQIQKQHHGLDGVCQAQINVGPKRGPRFYLDALYSSLVHFQPKVCLEIGTHTGNSTRVFQKYFDDYQPEGILITCDIKQYVDMSGYKNAKFVKVHPHMDNMAGIHYLTNEELLVKNEENWIYNSKISNIRLILKELTGDPDTKNARQFDFAFVDGDHQKESALADIAIAEYMLKRGCPYLFDDTDEFEHDCARLFHEEIKLDTDRYATYEFDDWDVVAGCAVILKKN